ncbi:hypothetical protein AB0M20_39575 [Actinoplanes sp. NPDC051633]|uniref:hypothetical protein n=1 Tax=Actinoplanes sp. NPDC051633 TaxID=3155670 RepID=UPI003446E66C
MQGRYDGGRIVLALEPDEARRLAAALGEVSESLSRAEFFIRTGASGPNIATVADQLQALASRRSDSFDTPVVAGVETEENPRRPRH